MIDVRIEHRWVSEDHEAALFVLIPDKEVMPIESDILTGSGDVHVNGDEGESMLRISMILNNPHGIATRLCHLVKTTH